LGIQLFDRRQRELSRAGGLILRDVRHEQHNFAKEMRLIGVRLLVEKVSPGGTVMALQSQFLPLTKPPFDATSPVRESAPAITKQPGSAKTWQQLQEFDDALFMATYFTDDARPSRWLRRAR